MNAQKRQEKREEARKVYKCNRIGCGKKFKKTAETVLMGNSAFCDEDCYTMAFYYERGKYAHL